MENKSCQDCAYFSRHYAKSRNKFRELNYGHCQKSKNFGSRKENDNACNKFLLKDLTESQKARISYLTDYFKRIAKEITALREIVSDEFKPH